MVLNLLAFLSQGLHAGVSREKFLTDERKKKMELVVVKYVNLEQQVVGLLALLLQYYKY